MEGFAKGVIVGIYVAVVAYVLWQKVEKRIARLEDRNPAPVIDWEARAEEQARKQARYLAEALAEAFAGVGLTRKAA
jgi:hypothetical protein